MSHRLIDLSDDLRRLRDEGYNVDIEAGHLVVRDVPYMNSAREIRRGMLVTSLDLNGDHTIRPSDHTIKFVGEYPCTHTGPEIAGIRHGSATFKISERITAQHSFSSKPPCGYYDNYYEKIKTYVAILSGPAAQIDNTIAARTYAVVEPHEEDTPFAYIDTASARAEINMVTRKLAIEKLAIVGLGGTGSYVLDLLRRHRPRKSIYSMATSSHRTTRSARRARPRRMSCTSSRSRSTTSRRSTRACTLASSRTASTSTRRMSSSCAAWRASSCVWTVARQRSSA
jgi:hypothetical protein